MQSNIHIYRDCFSVKTNYLLPLSEIYIIGHTLDNLKYFANIFDYVEQCLINAYSMIGNYYVMLRNYREEGKYFSLNSFYLGFWTPDLCSERVL